MRFPFSFWKAAPSNPPPPAFVPTDLAQLIFWQNGADSDSVEVDGDQKLIRQTDLSGNEVNKVPQDDAGAPVLTPDILNGVSLFRLTDTDALKLEKSLLPFDPGWDYQGPSVRCHVLKASLPFGSFGSIRSLFNSGFFQFIGVGENSGQYDCLGMLEIAFALTTGPSFLNAAWPGPIAALAPASATIIIISFKGTTRNEGMIYFARDPNGTIPGYFATLPLTPYNKSLCCSFVSGLGTAGTELFEAESFMSIEDSPTVDFASVRNYLLRWLGTIKGAVFCQGDSLCGGFGIGQGLAWPYRVSVRVTGKDFMNFGINGRTLAALADDQPAYVSLIRPTSGNIAIIDACTNDIAADDADLATCLSRLLTLAALWKGLGCLVYVCDVIPRNFSAPFLPAPQDPVKEAVRIAYNAALATLNNPNVDKVIRFTTVAPFNDPAAYANATYYIDDQVHCTAAGYQKKADIVFAQAFAE